MLTGSTSDTLVGSGVVSVEYPTTGSANSHHSPLYPAARIDSNGVGLAPASWLHAITRRLSEQTRRETGTLHGAIFDEFASTYSLFSGPFWAFKQKKSCEISFSGRIGVLLFRRKLQNTRTAESRMIRPGMDAVQFEAHHRVSPPCRNDVGRRVFEGGAMLLTLARFAPFVA